MDNDKIIYLEKYIKKEILICDNDCNIKDFCNNVDVNKNCIKSNGEELKKGEYVLINNNPSFIHIVRPTDTIESIAKKYGIGVEQIKTKNKINAIFIGQQLFI